MTKQEIYEQIVRLTSELHSTKIVEKIFAAVKTGDLRKVEDVFETFKKENAELYQKMVSCAEQYNKKSATATASVEIFGMSNDENEGMVIFDTSIINASAFCVFTFFGSIDEAWLFRWRTKSSEAYVSGLKKDGYEELAEFVCSDSWIDWVGEVEEYTTLYELLIEIFNGKFKEKYK